MKVNIFKNLLNSFFLFHNEKNVINLSFLFYAVENSEEKKITSLLSSLPEKFINTEYSEMSYGEKRRNHLDNYTPFFRACIKKNPHIIEAFLDNPKTNLNWKNHEGETCLLALFQQVNLLPISTLKKVINCKKIDLHVKTENNKNALHYLVQNVYHPKDEDTIEIFKELVEKGVDYKARHKINQKNVLDLAIEYRHESIVQYLFTLDIQKTYSKMNMIEQLYYAICSDVDINSNITKFLIDNGYNFNVLTDYIQNEKEKAQTDLPLVFTDKLANKIKELTNYVKIKEETHHLELVLEKSDKSELPTKRHKI
jgi:ankyrin repeat protein